MDSSLFWNNSLIMTRLSRDILYGSSNRSPSIIMRFLWNSSFSYLYMMLFISWLPSQNGKDPSKTSLFRLLSWLLIHLSNFSTSSPATQIASIAPFMVTCILTMSSSWHWFIRPLTFSSWKSDTLMPLVSFLTESKMMIYPKSTFSKEIFYIRFYREISYKMTSKKTWWKMLLSAWAPSCSKSTLTKSV